MDDYLNRELERNRKLMEILSKQLDNDKKNFINQIKSDLGKTIKNDFVKKKQSKKNNFWEKLKKIFK